MYVCICIYFDIKSNDSCSNHKRENLERCGASQRWCTVYRSMQYVMTARTTGTCDYELQSTHLGQVLSPKP